MDSVAILGSGFGLYGYLPALIGCNCREVVLPERYRKRFDQRAELQEFSSRIRWERNEQESLRTASGAVLALAPTQQMVWLSDCLERDNLKFLFLEKPLATSPTEAIKAQERLTSSNKVIRIAYLFRHLNWADRLKNWVDHSTSQSLSFEWSFMAHHFKQNAITWKREHNEGGGPLRFYGIHLIALLAEIGYQEVLDSSRTPGHANRWDTWSATLAGPSLPDCSITVSSASNQSTFSIAGNNGREKTCLFSAPSPFESNAALPQGRSIDCRVPVLSTFCESAQSDPVLVPEFYQNTIQLWQQVELAESRLTNTRAA